MIKKDGYFHVDDILEIFSQFKMLLGERSPGKSYSVKEHVLKKAWTKGTEHVYLRRWELDIKNAKTEGYYGDMGPFIQKLTGGECDRVLCDRQKIYLGRLDENGKPVRVKLIGHSMHLSGSGHYKSMSIYNNVEDIIFEEFISEDGYLENEVNKLMSIVSTVARKRTITVWMVGNTISRMCPYFREWGLTGVLKQQGGTIDIYRVKDEDNGVETVVAVEMSGTASGKSSMFSFSKNKMLTEGGQWESDVKAHLPCPHDRYDVKYKVLFEFASLAYKAEVLWHKEEHYSMVFVFPFTGRDRPRRVITDLVTPDKLSTQWLMPLTRGDKLLIDLIKKGKIVYSDNLTGTEFEKLLERKGV